MDSNNFKIRELPCFENQDQINYFLMSIIQIRVAKANGSDCQ